MKGEDFTRFSVITSISQGDAADGRDNRNLALAQWPVNSRLLADGPKQRSKHWWPTRGPLDPGMFLRSTSAEFGDQNFPSTPLSCSLRHRHKSPPIPRSFPPFPLCWRALLLNISWFIVNLCRSMNNYTFSITHCPCAFACACACARTL